MDSPTKGTEEVASDGGTNVEIGVDERRRWRVNVVCCAITGGTIGFGLGPAGIIGFAVLGAMIGDEWVRRTRDERAK